MDTRRYIELYNHLIETPLPQIKAHKHKELKLNDDNRTVFRAIDGIIFNLKAALYNTTVRPELRMTRDQYIDVYNHLVLTPLDGMVRYDQLEYSADLNNVPEYIAGTIKEIEDQYHRTREQMGVRPVMLNSAPARVAFRSST